MDAALLIIAPETQPANSPLSARTQDAYPSNDEGVSEVIGSILIVGLTVLMTGALVTLLLTVAPGPSDPTHAEFSVTIRQGENGWGSGDEFVRLQHDGGEPIYAATGAIVVQLGDTTLTYREGTSNPLDHAEETAFDDGALTIGERWRTEDRTIEVGTGMTMNVVDADQGQVVSSNAGRAGTISCTPDLTPPTVSSWDQSPSDVTSETSGSVTITATITDACNSVDTSNPPHLAYRLNDGSNPSYTDLGAMTQAGNDWTADISVSWASHGGKTLQYKATGMQDSEGNTGESTVQGELIDLIGTTTYVSSFTDVTGTTSDADNAKSDADNDAEATLQEGANGTQSPDLVTRTYNAQASSEPGSFTPGTNADASDDEYDTASGSSPAAIRYPLQDEGGDPGDIVSVVIKAEVDSNQHVNNWYLTPCHPSLFATQCGDQSGGLGAPTDGDTVNLEYNITDAPPSSLSGWSANDITGLEVEVDAEGQNQNADYSIDHVFVEVKYRPTSTTVYDLNVKADISGADGASSNVIQGEYRAIDDDFEVYVRDFTAGDWVKVADLTSSTRTTFSHTLTSSQIDASDSVAIRFLDATTAGTQGALHLDYLRVVASG